MHNILKNLMVLKMIKRKIKVGLDLTKKTKKIDNFTVQGDTNPDMDKIKISTMDVGLDLTKDLPIVIEYYYLFKRRNGI